MKIYSFYPNGEHTLTLVNESGFRYHQTHFVGKPMAHGWRPPKFSIMGASRPVRDFVSWSLSAPVVSGRAKDCLEAVIGPFVEFLPFATIKGKLLYAVNVIEVIDCLDRQASDLTYSPDEPGYVIGVGKYVFDKSKVRPVPIFKVPETMDLFVSDVFAQTVVDHKLTGAGFDDPENILWVKKPWNRKMEGLPTVRDFTVS